MNNDFQKIDNRGGSRHILSYEIREALQNFITLYIEKRILVNPGLGAVILPSTFSIKKMNEKYISCGGTASLSCLTEYFHLLYPFIRKQSKYSDYCDTCFILQKELQLAATKEEEEEISNKLEFQLELAEEARSYYIFMNVYIANKADPKNLSVLSFD